MSTEPGKLATSALDVSTAGKTVPPCSIFPSVKFRANFLNGVPAEIPGDGSRPVWMQAELFLKSLKHSLPLCETFKRTTSSSPLESHD
jgi:hypothetical protein